MKNNDKSIRGCFTKNFISEATKDDSFVETLLESNGLIKVRKAPKNFKVEWHTVENPTRLRKVFDLESTKVLKLFLNELIDYEDDHDHFAKLNVEGTNVTVEVNTRDIQTITQLDYEYAEYANDLYDDLMQALYQNMTIEK
tara:strand:- start:715 stop:1137 length:423 start_codon:yes stop_codon:yes gene_type:complete